MSFSPDRDAALAALEVNDRNHILNKSALHPKLQEDGKKPPEVLMELLDELDADLERNAKK